MIQVGADRPASLLAAGYAQRRQAHLLLSLRDGVPVVGPLVRATGTPCLNCLDLHRRDRDPGWPELAAQLAGEPDAPGVQHTDPAQRGRLRGRRGAQLPRRRRTGDPRGGGGDPDTGAVPPPDLAATPRLRLWPRPAPATIRQPDNTIPGNAITGIPGQGGLGHPVTAAVTTESR